MGHAPPPRGGTRLARIGIVALALTIIGFSLSPLMPGLQLAAFGGLVVFGLAATGFSWIRLTRRPGAD